MCPAAAPQSVLQALNKRQATGGGGQGPQGQPVASKRVLAENELLKKELAEMEIKLAAAAAAKANSAG